MTESQHDTSEKKILLLCLVQKLCHSIREARSASSWSETSFFFLYLRKVRAAADSPREELLTLLRPGQDSP